MLTAEQVTEFKRAIRLWARIRVDYINNTMPIIKEGGNKAREARAQATSDILGALKELPQEILICMVMDAFATLTIQNPSTAAAVKETIENQLRMAQITQIFGSPGGQITRIFESPGGPFRVLAADSIEGLIEMIMEDE